MSDISASDSVLWSPCGILNSVIAVQMQIIFSAPCLGEWGCLSAGSGTALLVECCSRVPSTFTLSLGLCLWLLCSLCVCRAGPAHSCRECCAGPQCLSPAGPPTLPHTPALCPYRDLAAPALRALRSFGFKLLLMKRGLCALLSQQLASVMFLLGKLRAALYNCQMFSSSKT